MNTKTVRIHARVVFEVTIDRDIEVTDENLTYDEASEIACELAERKLVDGDSYTDIDLLHINGKTPPFRRVVQCDENHCFCGQIDEDGESICILDKEHLSA